MKRVLDVVLAGVGLLALAPLLIVVASAIRVLDGAPVLYRQERVGRLGRPFRMLKFRTMRIGADRDGALLTPSGDPRVTPVGRWLRGLRLDELPQLVHVLGGEMSLVGPRPEVPRYVDCYAPDQRRVLALCPGLTDPATLAFADEGALLATSADPERLYVEEILPEKIRLNLAYADRATVWSDVRVIAATLGYLAATAGGRRRVGPDSPPRQARHA